MLKTLSGLGSFALFIPHPIATVVGLTSIVTYHLEKKNGLREPEDDRGILQQEADIAVAQK